MIEEVISADALTGFQFDLFYQFAASVGGAKAAASEWREEKLMKKDDDQRKYREIETEWREITWIKCD